MATEKDLSAFENMSSDDLNEIIDALDSVALFKSSDKKSEIQKALLRRFVKVFDRRLDAVEQGLSGEPLDEVDEFPSIK